MDTPRKQESYIRTMFKNYEQYKGYFLKLIQWERKEEKRLNLLEIKRISGEKREKLGRAILGMRGKDAGIGVGGTHLVKFTRQKPIKETQISPLDIVLVSRGRPTGKEPQGIVVEKTGHSLTVAFTQKPPRWVYGKGIRIDLFTNDITFQRMEEAIGLLRKNEKLLSLLLGEASPSFSEAVDGVEFVNENLNESQREAVINTLRAKDVFLIHGPPGTGKTTTLVESIIQHVKRGKRVLATADSNVAVDNMLERLVRFGINAIRIGHPVRISKTLVEHSLDEKIKAHEDFQRALELWEEVDRLREEQEKYLKPVPSRRRGLTNEDIKALALRGKSKRGVSAQDIKGMAKWIEIQERISELAQQARYLEFKAMYHTLEGAQVILATNSTAGSDYLRPFEFDVVFIDEATQSTEPSCLIPMVKGQKWILAGDHKQLPPTVISEKAQPYLQYTLFERLIDIYGERVVSMLTVQYRMNEKIMHFPNKEFYGGKLIAAPQVARWTIRDLGISIPENLDGEMRTILEPENVVLFVHVDGQEYQKRGSTSYLNEEEARKVKSIVESLLKIGLREEHIGVISPYDDQVVHLMDLLEAYENLEIKTVDGFQGREKEVIIISFVRANERGEIGFLNDLRRLNVAITRPRKKLIMVGNERTLSSHRTYRKLIHFNPPTTPVNYTKGKAERATG